MQPPQPTEILPGLYQVQDTCNVYIVTHGGLALAIDFGSGAWLEALPGIGVTRLEQVLITHHHADQVQGLAALSNRPFTVHAPAGEAAFMSAEGHRATAGPPWPEIGCPASYLPPPATIKDVSYDLAGFMPHWWRGRKLSVIHTPGHGPNACSIVLEHHGRQVVFCGDAAHAGATVWQPFHLEWDHWTGQGALAAWEGVQRLAGLGTDVLCPAHGPVVTEQPKRLLRVLGRRLLELYHAKGQISPGEADHFPAPLAILDCGAVQYLPHLYQFGINGYLLVSETGTGLVVDPYGPDLSQLAELTAALNVRPTTALVTHYHYDHWDGAEELRRRHGARVVLHPRVAEVISAPLARPLPWLHETGLTADELWPEAGDWEWEEYSFRVAPWPGQTWWHCAFMAEVDATRVLFGGDNFTPTGRWNGTGGFCAYNMSRFQDGFAPSARLALAWQPDVIAAGHGNYYAYVGSKFRKIERWAPRAEAAVRALCPTGDLDCDYYVLHRLLAEQAGKGGDGGCR